MAAFLGAKQKTVTIKEDGLSFLQDSNYTVNGQKSAFADETVCTPHYIVGKGPCVKAKRAASEARELRRFQRQNEKEAEAKAKAELDARDTAELERLYAEDEARAAEQAARKNPFYGVHLPRMQKAGDTAPLRDVAD